MRKVRKLVSCGLYFLTYCMLGWGYEVVLGLLQGRGFINRGYLFGPWLPVYGFGALVMLMLKRIKRKGVIYVFFVSAVIATVIELFASYLMESANGTWLWNYASYPYNFEGRIALWPSVRFGLLSVILLYIVQPRLEGFAEYLAWKKLKIAAIAAFTPFVMDCIARLFLGSNLKDAGLF